MNDLVTAVQSARMLLMATSLLAFSACGGASGGALPAASTATNAGSNLLSIAQFSTPANGMRSGFAGTSGQATYVFDLDATQPGTSQCSGACAASLAADRPA